MAEGSKMEMLNLENDVSVPIKKQKLDLEKEARQNLARIEALKTTTYTLQGLLDLSMEALEQIEILMKLNAEKKIQKKNELIELKKKSKELANEMERVEARIKENEEKLERNKKVINAFGGVERANKGMKMLVEIVLKAREGGPRQNMKKLFEPFVKEFFTGERFIWGDDSSNEVESGSQEG